MLVAIINNIKLNHKYFGLYYSNQDSSLELHLGLIPIPGPGGGAPSQPVQGREVPLWVRAGRWVSQPGASGGWQYAAGTTIDQQKDDTLQKVVNSKPPSWSRDSQPAWASQAGPKR